VRSQDELEQPPAANTASGHCLVWYLCIYVFIGIIPLLF
jgi:hypothetical protein